VSTLWLMPFYPTPDRDDGYDISDFYSVDPRLGTLGHFVEVVRTARDRGIRVIIDLVVNHASGHAAIVPRVVPGQRVAPDSHPRLTVRAVGTRRRTVSPRFLRVGASHPPWIRRCAPHPAA
jgi:hypothetical protein